MRLKGLELQDLGGTVVYYGIWNRLQQQGLGGKVFEVFVKSEVVNI
jgi:hypothetical protein